MDFVHILGTLHFLSVQTLLILLQTCREHLLIGDAGCRGYTGMDL